jgi:ankyrin repeat protein
MSVIKAISAMLTPALPKPLEFNGIDVNGNTPLLALLEDQPYELVYHRVKFLLSNGADPNKRNPLVSFMDSLPGDCNEYLAEIWKDRIKSIEALVEAGADVNAVDSDGVPVKELARRMKDELKQTLNIDLSAKLLGNA